LLFNDERIIQMSFLFGSCLLLGVICLLYYGVITIYAGINTAFAWFWLCAGLGFIIISLIISYVIKHGIRIPVLLRFITISVVLSAICVFLIIEGMIINSSMKKAEPGADYLIVLGAQVRGTVVTKSLKKRLDTAYEYLTSSPDTIAVVSGGQGTGEDISEAEAMKRYLVAKGLSQSRIITEDKSTNTEENIRYSRLFFKKDNPKVVIVTNSFHIFRALKIAHKQGIFNAQGMAAPSDRILVVNYYIREAAGVLKDFLYGNI
jgi:uncharacterized SAM-binding protein YcdF (DUF218 family)